MDVIIYVNKKKYKELQMKKIIIMPVSDNGFKFGGNMLDSESLLVKYYYARSGYGDIDFNLKCSMSFFMKKLWA